MAGGAARGQPRDLPRCERGQQGRRLVARPAPRRTGSAGQGEDRSMILLTPELRYALRANDIARRAADRDGKSAPNPVPVVKLFNPVGAATWLATELADDGDTLFGLARSEEHTSELQSLMRISYAVFCLKKKTK